jgi:hypothetical protein
MPYAVDRREKMWTAANLNSLYSRFDQKCARVLDDKSPLFADSKDGPWVGQYPYGVWYVYRNDPDSAKRLVDDGAVPNPYIPGIGSIWRDEHSETAAKIELSKLENKHLDVEGGQVYVDRFVAAGDPFTCDVARIHYSFELHRREIAGVEYDVHLGWDPTNAGLSSYVRGSLGPIDPTLPPGRIHKHRLAVAEIAVEGLSTFSILRSYQRYDCWRVHNCGSVVLRVNLQNPDGSSVAHFVPKGACRAFRRKPDGTWLNTWPGGGVCTYFFPYLTGDVPFFAGGPPQWAANATESPFLALERSAQANNVANPFILLEWRREMGAIHDPFASYDIRQIYQGTYADPGAFATAVGDCVFTWGRARVQYIVNSVDVIQERIVRFNSTAGLIPGLRSLGVTVVEGPTSITLSSTNTRIRIIPIDANIFCDNSQSMWDIGSSPITIPTTYPTRFFKSTSAPGGIAEVSWTVGNEVTIFDSILDLRRKIAVEEGFFNTYTDAPDIIEEKVSTVTMTPLGLVVRATSSSGIVGDLLVNYEVNADNESLWIGDRPINWGVGPWLNSRYTSTTTIYYLQQARTAATHHWVNKFPTMAISADPQINPAVDCAFVPPGGPWGFSSGVYDAEKVRAWDLSDPADARQWGADFWVNKWGAAGGTDASVRIPGSPNRTRQLSIVQGDTSGTLDDIFKDQEGASFASTIPLASQAVSDYDESITEIIWTYGNHLQFDIPFSGGFGGGPVFHKLPKSTWLWNLLEWSVRGWTRAVPLCSGQLVCPLRTTGMGGTTAAPVTLTIQPYRAEATGYEASLDMDVYYCTEAMHDVLIANGVPAYKQTDPFGTDYWFAQAVDLASYCNSMGFSHWNWDTQDGRPTENPPVAATRYKAVRNYGPGERVQVGSYLDVTTGDYQFLTLRYVDLRLPNEQGA